MKWAWESRGKKQKPISTKRHNNKEYPEKGKKFMGLFLRREIFEKNISVNSKRVILSNYKISALSIL